MKSSCEAMSTRLVIVSNRLPVTITLTDGSVSLTPGAGGLATGLRPWHESGEGIWIGWPGDASELSVEQVRELDGRLAERRIVPVHLSRNQVDLYYHGFANRVLWPLFHYQVDRVPVGDTGWEAYRLVNERFADAVWREYRAGDTIWVHDYQLMLVPSLLRERIPDARIGFFLHIPFPSPDVFRVLPWRREVLQGLLGADLVGFHTFAYMRHFVASLLDIDGVEADIDRVRIDGHEVRLGVFPMGVDAQAFAALAHEKDTVAEVEAIRRDAGDRRIVLGVDRLDYTKGIPRRLHAIERLLMREPGLADSIRYVQVAVPSRGEVDSYQRFKRQVEEFVGRINGAYGTVRSAPVHYIHYSVSTPELVALYCAADVMLVTPLRDGMNLVAKEFAASRVDEDGVLVLSEFAGAATELDGAIVVNPYDVEAVADGVHKALSLSREERRVRMKSLRRQVSAHDVHAWGDRFVQTLCQVRPSDRAPAIEPPGPSLATALAAAQRDTHLRLLLDYDGTLVPLAKSPELAAPDGELLDLLERLAAMPGMRLDIVSGRPRVSLETWLGHLPISLWAEYGFWHRPGPGAPWFATATAALDWQDRIRPILEQFVASTPGSFIEVKSASIAWHFRGAQREHGARQAQELRTLLGTAVSKQPWSVFEGKKVVEVRLRAVDKGSVARRVAADCGPNAVILAIGDDRTDEDLFGALPPTSLTVGVGLRSRHARFFLDDYRGVRRILLGLPTNAMPMESA